MGSSDRVRRYPFIRRTGQLGRWYVSQALVIVGGVAMFVSHQFLGRNWWIALDLIGLSVGLVGFMLWTRSGVCPSCGAKPWWIVMNGKATGIPTMEACPRCGYKPPPTAEELVER